MPLSLPSNYYWRESNKMDATSWYQKGWWHRFFFGSFTPEPLNSWGLTLLRRGKYYRIRVEYRARRKFLSCITSRLLSYQTLLAAYAKNAIPPPSQQEPPSLRVLQDLIHDVAMPTTTNVPKVLQKRKGGYIAMRSLIKV